MAFETPSESAPKPRPLHLDRVHLKAKEIGLHRRGDKPYDYSAKVVEPIGAARNAVDRIAGPNRTGIPLNGNAAIHQDTILKLVQILDELPDGSEAATRIRESVAHALHLDIIGHTKAFAGHATLTETLRSLGRAHEVKDLAAQNPPMEEDKAA